MSREEGRDQKLMLRLRREGGVGHSAAAARATSLLLFLVPPLRKRECISEASDRSHAAALLPLRGGSAEPSAARGHCFMSALTAAVVEDGSDVVVWVVLVLPPRMRR